PDILDMEQEDPKLMELIIESTFSHYTALMNNVVLKQGENQVKYNMNDMEMRPYQKECLEAGLQYFKNHHKGILWSAGGTGKTFMAISLYNYLIQDAEPRRSTEINEATGTTTETSEIEGTTEVKEN